MQALLKLAVAGLIVYLMASQLGLFPGSILNFPSIEFSPSEANPGDKVAYTTSVVVKDTSERNVKFNNLRAYLLDPNTDLHPKLINGKIEGANICNVVFKGKPVSGELPITSTEFTKAQVNEGYRESASKCAISYFNYLKEKGIATEVPVSTFIVKSGTGFKYLGLKGSFTMPDQDKTLLIFTEINWINNGRLDWNWGVFEYSIKPPSSPDSSTPPNDSSPSNNTNSDGSSSPSPSPSSDNATIQELQNQILQLQRELQQARDSGNKERQEQIATELAQKEKAVSEQKGGFFAAVMKFFVSIFSAIGALFGFGGGG